VSEEPATTAGSRRLPAASAFAQAQFLLSCARLEQLPATGLPDIAFAGRSNAGKSSALNKITRQNSLARVSKTPGRTQLLNFFQMPGAYLVDLPGYGYAKVPEKVKREWGILVGGYLSSRQSLAGLVIVMDVRHPLTDYDHQILNWALGAGRRVHVLLTKADKLSRGAAGNTLQAVRRQLGETATVQLFSSLKGDGVDAARETLMQWIDNWSPAEPPP
jgi:GTP-binding protein